MRIFMMILLYLLSLNIYAKDFGVLGETYPIAENDFLSVLEKRVNEATANGRLATAQERWKEEAKNYRNRPNPVQGLTMLEKTHTFYFDPSVILSRDVVAPNGLIIAKAGTVVNPLKVMPLTETLIFLNADDKKEIAWCQKKIEEIKEIKKVKKSKIILVQGAILPTEKIFKTPIYFDQHGTLTAHFHITHVPAMIQQCGLLLRIDEVKV